MEKSRQMLEVIVRSLVGFPDDVSVEARTDEMGVLLTLHVAKEDMGLIIGRAGATAKALRVVVRGIGMTENARVNMKIAEPEGSTFQPNDPEMGSYDETAR